MVCIYRKRQMNDLGLDQKPSRADDTPKRRCTLSHRIVSSWSNLRPNTGSIALSSRSVRRPPTRCIGKRAGFFRSPPAPRGNVELVAKNSAKDIEASRAEEEV